MPGRITLKQYEIVGRRVPTETDPRPKIYKSTLFAANHVIAKQRFWRLMRMQNRIKKSVGQILNVEQIYEKNTTTIKNYGILVRFNSKTGVMNFNKEFRDVTLCGAVQQMYADMAARHRARFFDIEVIGTTVLPPSACQRPHIKQFLKHKVRFPILHNVKKNSRKYKTKFVANRPCTV
eukprot:TRINITY_DN4596_c0_g1_i1.p1 TRINITY_DN4596_c0_g1~~TRINITY_DN4596_c0_g1_i1.p1  ORF type:complete len:178 (-),score=47.12 TRINITY_DN4596_c0_g1_i1:69-602(-)